MLEPGKKALVFAAGQEKIVPYIASLGVNILATDMDYDGALEKGWVHTGHHSGTAGKNLESLYNAGPEFISEPDFYERVSFEFVDMNHLPHHLRNKFDFVWSTCSLEHVGSITLGQRFASNSMDLLKPGGVAVHTTEFTLTSNTDTILRGPTALWRRQDVEVLRQDLFLLGYKIDDVCWHSGSHVVDNTVDLPPYKQYDHIKLDIAGHACTSVGWVTVKPYSQTL